MNRAVAGCCQAKTFEKGDGKDRFTIAVVGPSTFNSRHSEESTLRGFIRKTTHLIMLSFWFSTFQANSFWSRPPLRNIDSSSKTHKLRTALVWPTKHGSASFLLRRKEIFHYQQTIANEFVWNLASYSHYDRLRAPSRRASFYVESDFHLLIG